MSPMPMPGARSSRRASFDGRSQETPLSKKVDAPVIRYLSSDECRRLVNRCREDLRQMVRAALLTGCRYGELGRMRCEDVNLDAYTVAVRQSKGGKPRHVVLTCEGIGFFGALVAGRRPRDLLMQRK